MIKSYVELSNPEAPSNVKYDGCVASSKFTKISQREKKSVFLSKAYAFVPRHSGEATDVKSLSNADFRQFLMTPRQGAAPSRFAYTDPNARAIPYVRSCLKRFIFV